MEREIKGAEQADGTDDKTEIRVVLVNPALYFF
jgi:hypothetical protein